MQDSTTATDGTISIYDKAQTGLKVADSLLIEGKEDWSKGGGSNPFAQLIGYYGKGVATRNRSPFVRNTVYPAFGVEVFGNVMR